MKTKLLKKIRKRYPIIKIENFDHNKYEDYIKSYSLHQYYDSNAIYFIKYYKSHDYFVTYYAAYMHLMDIIRKKYKKTKKEIRTKVWY